MIKVLFISSGNSGYISPFVKEQAEKLIENGVEVDYYLIKGHGFIGYLNNYKKIIKKITEFKPVIVHAHYGLSGLVAVIQRKIPVIVTFHGSDIHSKAIRLISKIVYYLSSESIFVSDKLSKKINNKDKNVIPCGVDLDIFHPVDIKSARKKMHLKKNKIYILFSSSFSKKVKNYDLASKALGLIDVEIELIELIGFGREEVMQLMNASNLVLMTSFNEGSPQFIKEAMACNIPIVSTDVGDVKDVIGNTKGCYITSFEPEDVADKIQKALEFGKRTTGRKDIKHLESGVIAKKIIEVYESVLNK